jgi:hypothetical protein
LEWMRASVPWIQSALDFITNVILICQCRPQVFEFCHIFKRFISYPYILVLSWVPMTRHDHILCLLCIYFYTTSLLASKGFLCSLLWYLYYRPTN